MPHGPGTYGRKVGRPKKKKKSMSIYERTFSLLERQDIPTAATLLKGGPSYSAGTLKDTQASDRKIIKAAQMAQRHSGKIAAAGTAAKWASRAADVAGLATGGLGTVVKKGLVKYALQPIKKGVTDYAKKKVAGAIGRETARSPVVKVLRKLFGGDSKGLDPSVEKPKKGRRPRRAKVAPIARPATPAATAPAISTSNTKDDDKLQAPQTDQPQHEKPGRRGNKPAPRAKAKGNR